MFVSPKATQIFEGASYLQGLKPTEMVMPAQDNLQWVLARQANYVDAMFRPDTGWIAFLWGRAGSKSSDYMDGYGIANILAKGGASTEDDLMQAVESLARGRIKRKYGPPGNKRIEIIWQGFISLLAWHRGRKTWYLAGWPGLVVEPEEDPVIESAKIDREADNAASSPKNDEPEPTEAQKKSGNYKKGHVRILGLDIAIENPAGSDRSGTDQNGKKWTSKIHHHYGYIKRSEGNDGDHVDVFLGPDPEGADKVFVVNQINPETRKFDEHKCLMGFETEKEAKAAYLSNYEKGWKGLGSMAEMTVDEFKDWLKAGNTKKPVGDAVLESAGDWKTQIRNAKTLDDILVVFDGLFGWDTLVRETLKILSKLERTLKKDKGFEIENALYSELESHIRKLRDQDALDENTIKKIENSGVYDYDKESFFKIVGRNEKPWKKIIRGEMGSNPDNESKAALEALLVFVEAADRAEEAGYGPVSYTEDGGIMISDLSPNYLFEPKEKLQSRLLGLQAIAPDQVKALITHDLNSGEIKSIEKVLSAIRGESLKEKPKQPWEMTSEDFANIQFATNLSLKKDKFPAYNRYTKAKRDAVIAMSDVISGSPSGSQANERAVNKAAQEAREEIDAAFSDGSFDLLTLSHEEQVTMAYQMGKDIPESVLAEYPNIKKLRDLDNSPPPLRKVGEKQDILGLKDAVVTHAIRLDDVDYELYKDEKTGTGAWRIFDAESGNVVGIGKHPEFLKSLAKYAEMVNQNGGTLKEARQEKGPRFNIGDYVRPTKESGLNPEFWGGEITHITRSEGVEYIAVNGQGQHYPETDFERSQKPTVKSMVSGMKAIVSLEDERLQDVPEGWIIMNAPRPLIGDKEWQGDFRHGVFYAAIDPNNDEPPGAEWRIQQNKDLDGWVLKCVSQEEVNAYVRAKAADLNSDADVIEAFMRNKDSVRQSFFHDFENKTFQEVEELLGQRNIMESAETIFEMADPDVIDSSNWEYALDEADSFYDISNIFKILFRVPTDAEASPYFEATDRSIIVPIDKLVRREKPTPKRLEHAHQYMKDVQAGTGKKRGPIHALAMGNGKYKILDGNTTLQALKDLGEGHAVVEVKKTLKQQGVETMDDLYEQAAEAQPLFTDFMEKWGAKTGGKVMIRPGLKSKKRSIEKVNADKHGTFAGLKDILAGTLVFDTVNETARAFRMLEHEDCVFRLKNRYETPLPSGYRDIFMNISLPNGHIAELQLNTQSMIDAKEKGLGHEIYDITRQLSPVAEKAEGDTRFVARGVMEELNDLSRKVYAEAARSSSSSRVKSSAKTLASVSEMTREFDLILKAMSGSSTLAQVDLSLPPMENVSQESLSKAKGDSSSYNKYSTISFPPGDNVTENLTESMSKVKHIVGNPTSAFLFDNTPVKMQYAIVEVGDLKTSHDDSMALSKDYPQEVQPRQRDRGAMQLQIKEMANKLNPERMAASPQASTGAPIAGPDLAVESGNGRTMALRAAYSVGEKGKEYREWLIQHSQEFGMAGTDVANMEMPVLVRMRVGKVADRAQFARDANKDELAQMSPVEVAKMDAETLTESDLSIFAPSEDGNIAASSNTAFIKRYIQKLGVNESAGYLTADGRPTKQLIDRIQAAIFQKAYEDESVLALVAEETNPDLRNILNGLTFAAKDFVKARAFAEDFDGIDIPKHAIAAGALVRKSREENVVIDEILSQGGLFGDIPEGTEAFARFIDKHIRSGKRIGRVLQVAADILQDHLSMRDQESLFEKPAPPTEVEIINRAIAQVEEEYSDKNGNLFESASGELSMKQDDPIFETSGIVSWSIPIKRAKTLDDIKSVFVRLFGVAAMKIKKSITDYKDDGNSDYGLKMKGKKAREELNTKAREIIARVNDPGKLTQEEIGILKQYSGKGGLTENSQYEYYTPTHVAEGVWDAILANGFENGNILDPSTGAGVFSGTKPKGAIMTGCDLDSTGSKIAQLLNPEDSIQNRPFEQLVMETPDDTFDGCITNVPFGDARGACAHDDPAYKNEKRIERYFILRALDKIKPGKLACFVAPVNIVGAKGGKWTQFRTAVSKKAEFLGAHKLPSKTFAAQGTDTVVDIVVFKKHPRDLLEKIDSIHLETLQEASVLWDQFISGEYWKGEGRKYIMGKYTPKVEGDRWSRETVDGDIDNEGLKRKLAIRFSSRIDWDALEIAEPVVKNYAEGDRRIINSEEYELQAGDWVKIHKAGSGDGMVLEAAKYGAKTYGELESILSSPKTALQLTADQAFASWKAFPDLMSPFHAQSIEFAMSQPRAEFREQVWRGSVIGGMIGRLKAAAEGDDATDADAMRSELQDIVVAEVEKYGHPKNNKGLVLTGESSRMFGLFLNAMDETGNFSDLLSGQVANDHMEFDVTNLRSIVEHLNIREGIENIELEDVQKLYAGNRKIESLGDIAEDDAVAVTPEGMIMPLGRYCSGDIYPKLQEMTKAMADETDPRITAKYQKQIDYIMKRRRSTKSEDIDFGLRQKWFSRKYVVDFLRDNGYPSIRYGVWKKIEEEDPVTGEKTLKDQFVEDPTDPFGKFIGYETASGWMKQLNKYLNGKNVTSSKKDTKEAYQGNARALEEQFQVWMQQHGDILELVERYNQKFNGYLEHEYGGVGLKLKGVSPQVKLHDFQSAAIQRLSEEGRGCLAFDVGLGKTFSALGLYAYNKQMGRSKKTCIVVPNAVLANWYHSSKKFLGNHDGVLTVGFKPKTDKDGNIKREVVKDERGNPKKNKHTGELEYRDALVRTDSKEQVWEDMWKIPQGNYSLVIMTKEKYGTIPMRPSTKRGFANKMVDRALISEKQADKAVNENSQGAAAGGGRERSRSYQGDKDRLNLAQKYSDEGTQKKGELPFFEDMGFTDVIVDECHEFKNSYEAGENTKQIAYLPTAPSAQRALDMAMKMNYLRGANGGRGAYLLSATPVTNSPFEIYNILSLCCPIDEFERFGIYTVDDFVRVFGYIEIVDKVKVSGDVASVEGLTGFQNLDGLRNLYHKYTIMKNAQDVDLPLPPHDEHNDMVDLTDEQQAVYDELRERAKAAAKPGSEESMFTVMRDMDRVTTDMDLYHHTMTFHFAVKDKDKVDAIIDKMPNAITAKIVEEGERITQNIPFEHSTRMEGDTYVLVVPEDFENLIVSKFPEMHIDEADVGHPITPKYAKLVERLRKHFEEKGKQLVFTEEKSQHDKIRRLIVNEVPLWKDVIGIINADTANGAKLQQISNLYNSGKLKIIVANKKAEVGVNLQKGTTAVHHLTLPWTPASIQQRNGRGVRQGNTAEHIDIYYYLGKGSFDQYRLDLLKKKSNWMTELFKGKGARAENANALDQDDYVDMLDADPEEAKKHRMEKLAKKAAERKAREAMISVNSLQVLASASHTLQNLDATKEADRAKLEKNIQVREEKLRKYEVRVADIYEGEKIRAKLRGLIETTKRSLDNAKNRLSSLDVDYAKKKTTLEARVKQVSGMLRHRAQKEGLPFDESLIDHPENAVASLTGVVVAKGDTYEILTADDNDHAAPRLRQMYGGRLLQITEVNPKQKWIKFESVTNYINIPQEYQEGSGSVTPIGMWPAKDMKKVSYSEDEIALKKMMSQEWHYIDLVEGKLSKELFLDHVHEINIARQDDCLVRTNDGLDAMGFSEIEDKRQIVYPEPQDENFRKEVCEMFLEYQRKNLVKGSVLYVMNVLFGSDWRQTAMSYGTMATETQLRTAAAEALRYVMDELLPDDDGSVMIVKARMNKLNEKYHEGLALAQKNLAGAVDNLDALDDIWMQLQHIEIDKMMLEKERREEEEKRKAFEDLKKDPNYKEVPANVADAFQNLGVTVKTNMTNMVAPGFKGRRGTQYEPFARWFLQDVHAKSGKLFRAKDILKTRYRASFFKNADDNFQGAWWHIPSSVDLKEVYELLE